MRIVAALLAFALPAAAQAQGRTVTRNSQHVDVRCAEDGGLSVIGNNNLITADRCSNVAVPGNNNILTLYMGAGGRLRVIGNGNRIRYVGTRPRIEDMGTRNAISAGTPGRD